MSPFRLIPCFLFLSFAACRVGAQEALINSDFRDQTCEMICMNSLEGYNMGIGLLSGRLPGDSLSQVKYFYEHYAYDLPCRSMTVTMGKSACQHKELNFLQTAINDMADPIVAFIITQTNYDLHHKLASGKNTVQWLEDKINSGDYPDATSKKYYMRILEFMKHYSAGK
ncbi:MAG: hypothetical protein JSS82_13800 [Bacteroidetes bacterium]|nr:hypothetical protein [Bacteroidota bacterium]